MQKKLWVLRDISEALVNDLADKAGVTRLMARVLINRGITEESAVRAFLNPSLDKLHDPFLLPDMLPAVDRISMALKNREKIMIFGDYDVDGVTSVSILMDFLRSRKAEVDYYIPERLEEGYGLSKTAAEKLLVTGATLIITVDCGITSIDEVDFLNQNGLDVIVTDHHECRLAAAGDNEKAQEAQEAEDTGNTEKAEKIDNAVEVHNAQKTDNVEETELQAILPRALAVINPCRPDCTYPFKELAGVGVAFKLVQALCAKLGAGRYYEKYLDLLALGTVADVVSLMDENRTIVKYGLKAIEQTENPGLRALINVSGLRDKQITTYSLGFVLAPRINAAGRIGSASRAVRLFTTDDRALAEVIAKELDDENRKRQDTEAGILNEALELIETGIDLDREKILVVAKEGWHHGIIGIVASKITERFHRPSILIAIDGASEDAEALSGDGRAETEAQDGSPEYKGALTEQEECTVLPEAAAGKGDLIGRGSARSIEGFNLFKALSHCKEHLVKFGGHEMAAGLSIKASEIDGFTRQINEYADSILTDTDLMPCIRLDAYLDGDEICEVNADGLELLSPFGTGNPGPVFGCRDMHIDEIGTVGAGKHLKLKLGCDGAKEQRGTEAIGFNMGSFADTFISSDLVDAVFSLEINSWNGSRRVQLNLRDIRLNEQMANELSFYNALDKYIVFDGTNDYNKNVSIPEGLNSHRYEEIVPERRDLESVYRYISICCRKQIPPETEFKNLLLTARDVSEKYGICMNYFKLKKSIEIFEELKFIRTQPCGEYGLKLAINSDKAKASLEESTLFMKLQKFRELWA